MIKAGLFSALFFVATSVFAGTFPKGPDQQLTPGEICTERRIFRYPERIAYCERNVHSETKRAVIKTYDQNLGYSIESMPRNKFKIDHYVPLCMGGSNNKENLWPQHESVYTITDPLEQESCEKMAQGKLRQAKAIELIKQAKGHLDQVAEIRSYIQSL